ncbi:MAG: type II secretion system protein [Dehalococcoidales bacterium]|nr:type II secretion system protein [Dehalococcoidales bacterium]
MRSEKGFTLVELVIAVGLTGVIIVVLGAAVYQILTVTQYGNDRLTAQHELQNAARWFLYDGQRAVSANITGGLLLTVSANATVDYSLAGTELRRTAGSAIMVLARNISGADFSLNDRLVTMSLTSAPAGRDNVSQNGTYAVYLRVGE